MAQKMNGSHGTASHPLIKKLKLYVDLEEPEIEPLARMLARQRTYPRGREIIVQGQPYRSLFVLNKGLALRYKILSGGKRQIFNLIVPGDLIGLPACLFESATASVSSLTDVTISFIEFSELFGLFRHSPRLSAALFWTSAREAGGYAERLATIGRRSAYERLAHIILEILTRLQAAGLADRNSFEMPLTQEMLADALGLSLQHINRMVRNLRQEGLASIEGHVITIRDLDSLVRLAGFEDTYLVPKVIPGL